MLEISQKGAKATKHYGSHQPYGHITSLSQCIAAHTVKQYVHPILVGKQLCQSMLCQF